MTSSEGTSRLIKSFRKVAASKIIISDLTQEIRSDLQAVLVKTPAIRQYALDIQNAILARSVIESEFNKAVLSLLDAIKDNSDLANEYLIKDIDKLKDMYAEQMIQLDQNSLQGILMSSIDQWLEFDPDLAKNMVVGLALAKRGLAEALQDIEAEDLEIIKAAVDNAYKSRSK
jgi:hypothetical protein